jgi:2-polyprenyl-6-methoxyphenol hydroxylase-like FAD-dependent oxidoreductase
VLERVLGDRLRRSRHEVLWDHRADALRENGHSVLTRVGRLEKHSMGYPIARTDWVVAKETEVQSQFVIGADGYHSFVRRASGCRFEHVGKAQMFAVFELTSTIDLGHEARVVLHEGTTNVVWPIGGNRVRWSFEVPADSPPLDGGGLRGLLEVRAPWFRNGCSEIHWAACALFEQRLVDRFGRGRTWLAGDAAHSTGPVGVQSMNVGLREAHDLVERISAAVKTGGDLATFERYEAERQREWRRLDP